MSKEKVKERVKEPEEKEVEAPSSVMSSDDIKEITALSKNIRTVRDDLASDVKYLYDFDCGVIDVPYGGGVPSGKILEYYGWESAGKSTFCLESVKNFESYWKTNGVRLKRKHLVLWIEAESALDKARAKWMGCDVDSWMIMEADTVETADQDIFKILSKAKENNIVVFIVWDTIAATTMLAEQANEGERMANKAAYVRKMLRKMHPLLGQTDSTIILVNQLTQSFKQNVKDETSIPGIRFYASIRMRVRKAQEDRIVTPSGDEITVGIFSQIEFDKNKLIQRGQKAMVYINNEKGIDKLMTSMEYLKKAKLANIKGAGWIELNVPERPFNKDNKDKIGMAQIKFQTMEKLQELIQFKYPHAKDWIEYLIYLNYTTVSPLVKVKIINKVWKYEEYFFGERKTTITDEEKVIADMLSQAEADEEEKMKDEK